MKALVFDKDLRLKEISKPKPSSDEILIKISKVGICNTDIEITRGYMEFKGILGHEFIGYLESENSSLDGKRVTAEINCSCGKCDLCKSGRDRHCSTRTVIGISGRDGALAEYITVPYKNVFFIPDSIKDENAIFIEPLAAALEILDQVPISNSDKVLVIGDGKLAQLISIVLHRVGCDLTVKGKHKDKLSHLEKQDIRTCLQSQLEPGSFDIVIEASGSPEAFSCGLASVKPGGIFVLKSTYASGFHFNPAPIVVNEITIVGSRCGKFKNAVDFLIKYSIDLSYLISGKFRLENALEAFRFSQQKDVLKVIIEVN